MTDPLDRSSRQPDPIGVWLLICCALLVALVAVGGATRLTRSGLSITEWQPLVGALPPLDDAAWAELFAKYRATPEYREVNRGMTLDGFRRIFWWEYTHRLLARLLGLAFLLPFLVFTMRRSLRGALGWRLAGVLVLGAMQGALGWLMVASGLVDDPRVSPFRLAAHLSLALILLVAMLWLALDRLRLPALPAVTAGRRRFGAVAFLALVLLQAACGALVAGTRAGYTLNTFPLMAGELVPIDLLRRAMTAGEPLQHVAVVQFAHRALAWALLAAGLGVWWRSRRTPAGSLGRLTAAAVGVVVAVQFGLGVATLLLRVPLSIAIGHQAGAVALLAAAVLAAHVERRPAA